MKRLGSFFTILVTGLIIVGSIIVVFRQDDVIDWWRLRDYEPPADIEQLARDTSMTDLGKRYFYVYEPRLLGRNTFRQECTVAEQSIILGCYISRQALYIFDVDDEQLAGIRQVTAAHEMLHVAYERLDSDERERIDALNRKAYESIDNERITKTVDAYRKRDPTIVANELHSILPTEVRELDDELENYYAQYFDDRLDVVSYSEQYADIFVSARERVEQLDDTLKARSSTIENLEQSLDRQARSLEQQREELNRLRDNNEAAAYNEAVGSFNQNVESYNASVNRLRNLIDEYNRLVAERNKAVVAYESLTESIDSGSAPIDTL